VALASSDSLSITRILSTTDAGRLFSAVDWSPKKNVRLLAVVEDYWDSEVYIFGGSVR